MFSSSPPREEDELPPGMLNYMYDKRGQPQMVDHNGADGQDHHHDDDETDENLAQLELELSSGKRENLLLLMPGIYYQKWIFVFQAKRAAKRTRNSIPEFSTLLAIPVMLLSSSSSNRTAWSRQCRRKSLGWTPFLWSRPWRRHTSRGSSNSSRPTWKPRCSRPSSSSNTPRHGKSIIIEMTPAPLSWLLRSSCYNLKLNCLCQRRSRHKGIV